MNEKLELIKKIQNAEQVYAIMSMFTKMPYVVCDEETFDDEVMIFFEEEAAKNVAKKLLEEKNPVHIAKVEPRSFLPFYTSLFAIGVNCLRINKGLEDETTLQNEELVKKPEVGELPDGKVRVENPEFHLTALYFTQEFRKNPNGEVTDKLKELYDEMRVHFTRGQYIIGTEEGQGLPVLKQKDGNTYVPLFTDLQEFQKFNREGKLRGRIIQAEKISEVLTDETTGVVVNPFGVNVVFNITKQ